MKTTFYVIVLALLVVSCNNNDDAQQNNIATLEGSWSLVNVQGGFAGVNDNFDIGLIIWNFETYGQFSVINNNTVNVIFDGLPSGTYDYNHLTTGGEDSSLVLDELNISYRLTSLTSSQLILDEDFGADGFLLTFSR